jgi:hypothetical protein
VILEIFSTEHFINLDNLRLSPFDGEKEKLINNCSDFKIEDYRIETDENGITYYFFKLLQKTE